ncbi:DUF4402 domain-containing protein [Flavobacterium sp. Arc3]|jgi:hypothetical protein|uniref:DUF4402 domain-containing protein n=1 Tax=unclassified Flavobacterium TaxID=196869 RepID=UPI00352C27A5
MKKIILLAFFAIAALSNNANAQTTNTQSTVKTNASAKLIKVMSVANADTDGLDFGTIVLTGVGSSTVIMEAADASRTYGTNSAAAVNANQSPNTAKYNVTGTPNETYALSFPTDPVVLTTATTATGGNTVSDMTITDFKARFNGKDADAVVSILTGSGTDSFAVGGTLNIKADQIPGVYTGTFDVTVDYN